MVCFFSAGKDKEFFPFRQVVASQSVRARPLHPCFQQGAGGFYHGVYAPGLVVGIHVQLDVGVYAKLDVLPLGIEVRTGGEAHAPAVGQFTSTTTGFCQRMLLEGSR